MSAPDTLLAFPTGNQSEWGPDGGMSLRDYFAGQVLASLRAHGDDRETAVKAYRIADAMLIERERYGAAAPDMFEALEKLERWFDTDPEILAAMDADTRADHERQHGMIRAAIAKAKGGAA